MESYCRLVIRAKRYIVSIIPALDTDGEKPVTAEKIRIVGKTIIVTNFFRILKNPKRLHKTLNKILR